MGAALLQLQFDFIKEKEKEENVPKTFLQTS